jgi:hypothetical protein
VLSIDWTRLSFLGSTPIIPHFFRDYPGTFAKIHHNQEKPVFMRMCFYRAEGRDGREEKGIDFSLPSALPSLPLR